MSRVRRYPRVPFEARGEMEVRGEQEPVRIPMTVRSISCEGAGVVLADRSQRLRPGASVTLKFRSGRDRFELPGRVAWATHGEGDGQRFDLGVRFQLAAVQHAMRQSYARWVVGLIRDLRG